MYMRPIYGPVRMATAVADPRNFPQDKVTVDKGHDRMYNLLLIMPLTIFFFSIPSPAKGTISA